MSTPKTADPTIVGRAYQLAMLDSVWELLYAVARNFTSNPEMYTGECKKTTDLLTIPFALGTSTNWPNQAQRAALYSPLLGKSGPDSGPNRFENDRQKLLAAAAMLTSAAHSSGQDALKESFATLAQNFKRNNIEPVLNEAAEAHVQMLEASIKKGAEILRDASVARRFGITDAIDGSWPWQIDSNGTKLVESIAKTLKPSMPGNFVAAQFADLQHVGLTGRKALELLANASGTFDQALLSACISWYGALKEMPSRTAAASVA